MLYAFHRNPPQEEADRNTGADGKPLPLHPGGIGVGRLVCGIFADMDALRIGMEDGEYVVYEATESDAKDATVPVPSSLRFHSEIKLKTPNASTKATDL
jgi:hypothetical protein